MQAHLWIDLAASASTGDDQNVYSAAREAVAAKMTTNQVAEKHKGSQEFVWHPGPTETQLDERLVTRSQTERSPGCCGSRSAPVLQRLFA